MISMPLVFENGEYTRRLHPFNCSVFQSLAPLSTANMTLPATDEINAFDWVKIFTPDGKAEYYRCMSVSEDMSSGEKTVYLEHGAGTLGDIVIPDTSSDIVPTSGSAHGANKKTYSENKTDTVANILTYILGKQGNNARWSVGTVESANTIYIELGGFTLLASISAIMQYIPDYQLEFEQRTETDWRVNIKHRPTVASCEGRLSRNLTSCEVSRNASGVVTRVYCDGIGYTDSANIALYGLHEEHQSLSDNLNTTQKQAIIDSYLSNHDHPIVSISISGVELSQVTGLAIDQFNVGQVCRIAIPWLSVEENEVIIDKQYADVYNEPESVTITLANATPDLVIDMAAVTSTVGGGMGGGMAGNAEQKEKEKKRFETHFEQADEYFRFIATDTQWDAMGQGTLTGYGQFVLTHDSFQVVIDKIGEGDIDAGTAKITPATIALSINKDGSQAYIAADHVWIGSSKTLTIDGCVYVKDGHTEITAGEYGIIGAGNGQFTNIELWNLTYHDGNGVGRIAHWKEMDVVTSVTVTAPSLSVSSRRNFVYERNGDFENLYSTAGRLCSDTFKPGSVSAKTTKIYYLGREGS